MPRPALHAPAPRADPAREIDPSFVITHRMHLEDAPRGFEMFVKKEDNCEKVVLTM